MDCPVHHFQIVKHHIVKYHIHTFILTSLWQFCNEIVQVMHFFSLWLHTVILSCKIDYFGSKFATFWATIFFKLMFVHIIFMQQRSTTNWRFEEWLIFTLKNNSISCKKRATIVSAKQLLRVSSIVRCYFSKWYSIILQNASLWCFIVVLKELVDPSPLTYNSHKENKRM